MEVLKNVLKRYGDFGLWGIVMMGCAFAANAAEAAHTTIPTTDLVLDSGHHLLWSGGPLVKICTADKSDCTTGKMPKTIGTFFSVSAITNLSGAKASWRVTSSTDSFICSLLPLSTKITCAKIPPAPTKLVRSGSTVKVETLDNSKAIAEVRSILEGELAYSTVYMSSASNTTSVCEIPPQPADTEECHYDAFDVDNNEWVCVVQPPPEPPEDPNDCATANDDACDGSSVPDPEDDLPVASSPPPLPPYIPCGADTGGTSLTLDDLASSYTNIVVNPIGFCSCRYAQKLISQAKPSYVGQCAKYVRQALEAGNADTTGHPYYAKDYGQTLLKNGFTVLPRSGYIPAIGDTVVFNGTTGYVAGHIEGFTASGWVSDTIQNEGFFAAQAYRTADDYKIYRPPASTCSCN